MIHNFLTFNSFFAVTRFQEQSFVVQLVVDEQDVRAEAGVDVRDLEAGVVAVSGEVAHNKSVFPFERKNNNCFKPQHWVLVLLFLII